MPLQPPFEMGRAQLILRDLLKTTRGQAPMLEMSPQPGSSTALRGLANRSGLMRLGLRLALAALEEDPVVSVHSDGLVTGQGAPGVLEIVLTEQTTLAQPPKQSFPILGCISGLVLVAIAVALAIIGFGTLLTWLDH